MKRSVIQERTGSGEGIPYSTEPVLSEVEGFHPGYWLYAAAVTADRLSRRHDQFPDIPEPIFTKEDLVANEECWRSERAAHQHQGVHGKKRIALKANHPMAAQELAHLKPLILRLVLDAD